ncbi:MAG: alpha/beta fold hydrolase [Longimicrobiales bacterium]
MLIGHSAAAVAAVRFATQQPDLVSAVVNVDAIVANLDTYGFSAEQRRQWADAELQSVLAQYDNDSGWQKLNAAPPQMRADRAAFYHNMWLKPARQNVFSYWRDWLRTDVGRDLPHLRVPFLAIHALPADGKAASTQRAQLEERYRRAPMPPGARVVFVTGSGHTIWEYKPVLFDQLLAEFISGSNQGARN